MTVTYSITYEFDSRPPMTHRGTVAGSAAATCVARATRIAQKALRPVGWSSVVCVLLERLETTPDEQQADDRELAGDATPDQVVAD